MAVRKRGVVIALSVVLVALVAVAVGGALWLWRVEQSEQEAIQSMDAEEAPAVPDAEVSEDTLPQNPIDFAALKAENSDIFAWLYIPGCDISVPLVQSPTDDFYYLSHNRYGEDDPLGTPFMQLANSRDLTDPVTVVYGHNKGLFGTLHYFEDAAFFEENTELYVYVPGHIYTYTVVSAYQYDSRHILNSFDFSNEEVRADYFAFVQDPDSILRNVNPDVTLDADSRLLQLSTCTTDLYDTSARFIVTAVQTADTPTL